MNERRKIDISNFMSREVLVGTMFLGVVMLLMVPLAPVALDLLLAVSIALSTVVFLTALFTERPTDFSVFPTLLLIATLLRLSLNVASTRLILLHGHEGADAAGEVILAFGAFVVGGNVGVGIIIFLILVIINFVVITKGSGRIAEVSARFTLDAMPGKQMAIDAELNSGTINDSEARERRAELDRQTDFYGAMDGSSKFVRGDAIAGLIITGINLVGGIAIGMTQQNLSFSEAVETYSLLTVGDGLVSQMPALVVSTAAGVVISRATGRSQFGAEVIGQLLGVSRVLGVTAGFLLFIGFLPGLPFGPFAILGGVLGYIAYRQMASIPVPEEPEDPDAVQLPTEQPISDSLRVEVLTLEVGYGLLSLVDASRGGDIPDRVKKLRRQLAEELGIIIPRVRVVDNLHLPQGVYSLKLYGTEVARGEAMADRLMAIDSAGVQSFPGGIKVTEPVFDLDAFWILPEDRAKAESNGLTVVDPSTVLITHIAEVLRKNADQLIGRDEVNELISVASEDSPKLIEELLPNLLTLGEIVAVLQTLLSERIPIRNLKLILEALATAAPKTRDTFALAEIVRAALWRQISELVRDDDGSINMITIDQQSEHLLRISMGADGTLAPSPNVYQNFIQQTANFVDEATQDGHTPCMLVSNDLRRPLQQLLRLHFPDFGVVALRELDKRADLKIFGTISEIDSQAA